MGQQSRSGRWQRSEGYSLLEMLLVAGLLTVISSIAVIQAGTARQSYAGDGGMRTVLGQFNTAREMAITQRKYMRVVLTAPNLVQVLREDTTVSTTTMSSVPIEGRVQFTLTNGLPDTPDAFGYASAVDFGTAVNVKFTPDGTMVNQDGQTWNGSVFLAIPQMPLSARAVTVLGSTGRVRGYRWTGRAWKLV
jgi:type II secretory pathway pseudopilin PulG